MTGYAFAFCGQQLVARPSGALHWPAQDLLCVSDLHFGKSARAARHGGALLPPYETRATLTRLSDDLDATTARTVICLGDSFDDISAAENLGEQDQLWLLRLMAGRNWIWVEGNHDPGPVALGGSHRAEVLRAGISFRHAALAQGRAEISGHYHPKARLAGLSRPCFLLDENRLILPAYGAYTGGLWTDAPALLALMQPAALALLTGTAVRPIPMPRGQTSPRASSFGA